MTWSFHPDPPMQGGSTGVPVPKPPTQEELMRADLSSGMTALQVATKYGVALSVVLALQ